MAVLRELTVNLVDLNLEEAVIDGATVSITLERAVSFDTFIIVPTLNYKAASDNTGILLFNILPNNDNTRYRVSVSDATGSQVLDALFTMPNEDAELAMLLRLSYYPDGFNVDDVNATSVQYKSNGGNLGTPVSVRKFDVLSDGLFTYSGTYNTVTLNLQSLQDAITGFPAALAAHVNNTNNPHETTAAQVGLGNVNNTSDANKPISTATQAALDDKEDHINTGTTGQYWRGDKTWQTLDKAAVGLSNVVNLDTSNPANITWSASYRTVTDTEKATWNGKQDALGFTPFNAANVDTDGTLSANSDSKVASQKAAKTYADSPKSTVVRIVDGTDATKKLAFDVTTIPTGTTKTITMPGDNVNLGYVPKTLAISGGILTLTGVGNQTLTANIGDYAAITLSSGMNLVAGKIYQCSADTSIYTVNLPTSPSDGDIVVIKDTPYNKNSRIGTSGVITVNGGSHDISYIEIPATTLAITGPSLYADSRFTYRFVYSSFSGVWLVSNATPALDYLRTFQIISSYPGSTKTTQLISQANGNNRSIQFPDYDIDLYKYNTLPRGNSANGNAVSGSNAAILGGGSNKATKANQVVLTGLALNADTQCPEDSAIYGFRTNIAGNSCVTGYLTSLKGKSTSTAAAVLENSNTTTIPAYLTKPTGHYAVSVFEFTLSHTTTAGKVWMGVRRVCVKWDGTTATTSTQTVGTDYDPDTQTIVFTPTVSSGLLTIIMQNSTAGGGDTCYWQCTLTAHHNGG